MFNIIVTSDSQFSVNKLAIQATVLEVLQSYGINSEIELGVNVIGERKMHAINKQYRGIDSPTNILTFALEDQESLNLAHLPKMGFVTPPEEMMRLGDILISYPQVVEDAHYEGVSVEEEIRTLVEHGVKHLLGMHHD